MPAAACVTSQTDRVPAPPMLMSTAKQTPAMMPEAFAKDAIIAWFRGEFAAANAMIDALCSHLTLLEGEGGGSEYASAFAAIHRRRMNWIPILQMQKYYSIADVVLELKRVSNKKAEDRELAAEELKAREELKRSSAEKEKIVEEPMESHENGAGEVVDEDSNRYDSPESDITDTGSQEVHPTFENNDICANHNDCETRCTQIKMTKGFVAKEPVKGHMVNVVRGLKLYEDVFTDSELSKLTDFVNELRVAGQNGELSGDTFILYNQQLKGIKRELIQLGAPIFGQIKEEAISKDQNSHIEPIPALLEDVIDHLVQWHLLSENRRPNSCIVNFFDEGEFSQPFLKPPHLDQPITTLLLSDSTMAFGRTIVSDSEGNYKGPLILSLKEGSLIVMRGNSADMARHSMCASENKRISITFFRVRLDSNNNQQYQQHNNASSTMPHPMSKAMTLWQPGVVPSPYMMPNGVTATTICNVAPKWGVIRAPVVMLAPVRQMVLAPKRMPRGSGGTGTGTGTGTGVFLPWSGGSRKPAKHLPPRAQRGRPLALPSPVETQVPDSNSDIAAGISMEEKVI